MVKAKEKFTAGRIADFQCPEVKLQAFMWCPEVQGLGVRSTPNSARKRFIYESKVKGKSLRLTIGEVGVWTIPEAQAEARRLQVIIDSGQDPRKVKADAEAAELADATAQQLKEKRETVTLKTAWDDYLADRKPHWSDRHYKDHIDVMHAGGEKRKRDKRLTKAGVLASLASVRLVDLTSDAMKDWAKDEGKIRSGRARLALRLLKACLSWCMEHKTYKFIVTENTAKNKSVREKLGKPKKLDDVLEKEQLTAWFAAVKKIGNPVISAYLQAMLLTGARPNELIDLRWENVGFKWSRMTIGDKIEGQRTIPLPPYLASILNSLPRRSEWVFSSPAAASGHLEDPHDANYKVCAEIGNDVTLHGVRRSFATLSEWIEMPEGISAQIQGHAPEGVREKHYKRRPLDLLRVWHNKFEAWILEQAGIEFVTALAGLQLVKNDGSA